MPDSPEPARERRFNPSRYPTSPQARQLVQVARGRIDRAEEALRRRKRTTKAQGLHAEAVSALVCDLAYAHLDDEGARLTVELSKQRLSAKQRRTPFLTERFAHLVRLMADVGLVELAVGSRTPFGNVRSTVAPGEVLRKACDELRLTYSDFSRRREHLEPAVVLRAPKRVVVVGGKVQRRGENLALPPTAEVEQLFGEMEKINSWLADADIEWDGEGRVDVGERHLQRIFNNGSLQQGGRLYGGFWQRLSVSQRLGGIVLQGVCVVQLDFAQFGLRMAYAEVGAEAPARDLYALPGYGGYRKELKALINALLCSESVPMRFPPGTRGGMPKHWSFGRVLDDIRWHHAPIVPLFGTSAAMRTMYRESQVLVRALLKLRSDGIVALPVHDAILVSGEHCDAARTAMEGACQEVTGVRVTVEVER